MARISRYPQDNLVEGTDKLIGTNEDGDVTKTYTLTSLGEWLKYNTRPIATLTSADGTQFIVAAANDGTIQGIPLDSVAPNITSVPVITGTLNVGETLTATPGAFTGIPEPTTALQWQRSDDRLTGWSDIAGATGTTYLLGSLDEDKYIRVQQTEENILGTATANSASTGQIQPVAFSGLLDEYPNAAAAYSLRKLRLLYSGSAIKVRRDSDQALQDIGFVNNELDIATLESFCSGTDGFVHTWYDQSGSGNDATQTSASSQPQIVSSGSTILENGKPAVQFDGSDDNLNTSAFEMTSAFSVFGAFNMSATSGYRALISHNFVSSGSAFLNQGRWILTRTAGAGQDWQGGDAAIIGDGSSASRYPRFISNGSVFSSNTQYVVSGVLSNTTSQLWANGSASTARNQQTASITSETGKVYIGSSEIYDEFQGKIQEVMIWDIDQSSNRTGIETNINDFYSIY